MPWLESRFRRKVLGNVSGKRPWLCAADIEDALQDVLTRIVTRIVERQSSGKLENMEAYVTTAVLNRLIDFQRRDKYLDKEAEIDVCSEGRSLHGTDPAKALETIERSVLFVELMQFLQSGGETSLSDRRLCELFTAMQKVLANKLSNKQWIILRLKETQGFTLQQCADALNVSLGSVHGWHKKTLQICAGIFEQFGIDSSELL